MGKDRTIPNGSIVSAGGVYITPQRGQLLNDTWQNLTDAYAGFVAIISRIDEVAHNGKTIPHAQIKTRLSELGVSLAAHGRNYKSVLLETAKVFPIDTGYIDYVMRWASEYSDGIDAVIKGLDDGATLRGLTRDFPINQTFARYMDTAKKAGVKSDTEYDAAVLKAVAETRTRRDAMKVLQSIFPDRVGDPYREADFHRFVTHVKRLKK